MKTNVIKNFNALSVIIQHEINQLRQQYDKDYASSHDETFRLITVRTFNDIARLSVEALTTNNALASSSKLKEAEYLILKFIHDYQALVSPEFRDSLKHLNNFLKAYKVFFNASILISMELLDVLILALEETEHMMDKGIDLSDPVIITPLGWTANKYPEIAEYCNELLRELAEEQEQIGNPPLEIEDKTMTGEF